jgi:serine protease Do
MLRSRFFSLCLLGLALVALTSPAAAEAGRVVPTSNAQLTLSFAPVAKRVAPAVVNIYTRKLVRQRVLTPFMDDPLFQQFFGRGAMRQRMENALGSGVLVKPDGLIVTSNHVIAGADEITVVLADKREYEATLVLADENTDLAALRIDTKGEALPYLELRDSDDVEVGDLVLAIGNPFGVGQTVTSGIISALARATTDRSSDTSTYIQTDAAINPGNSGGALVTLDGRLIGINAAIYSKSGGNMGIGFAVPSNMVRSVMAAAASGKKVVVHAWTGIEGQDVTADLAASLSLPRPLGVLVTKLYAESPAQKAGLRPGDVIVAVNGKPIDDKAALAYRLASLPLGDEATCEVMRRGQKINIAFRLSLPPEDTPRAATKITGENPLQGATLANLSPALAQELRLGGETRGVVLTRVDENGAAARLGLAPGDVVLEINGKAVKDVASAVALLKKERGHRWRLLLQRDGDVIRLMVGL